MGRWKDGGAVNWKELTSVALLGTGRQNTAVAPVNGMHPLSEGLALAEKIDSPERRLLHQAALLMAYQRAGQLATQAYMPDPVPSAEETQAPISPRAAMQLRSISEGDAVLREVIDEWLTLTVRRNERVSEELIPALLDMGRQHIRLRKDIVRVIGQRGVWLAAQNPDWGYASTAQNAEGLVGQWESSPSAAARQIFFAQLRECEPRQARLLLEQTWKTESAEQRYRFVDSLATNLSLEDEPFLESALDDRSREVALASVGLLSRLPGSRLVQRMIARVNPILQRKGRQLQITLPKTFDPAWRRDGIEETPSEKRKKGGERGYWVEQMLSLIPTQYWQQMWQVNADALMKMVQANDYRDLLSVALQMSAQRSLDFDLLMALLPSLSVESVAYKDALLALPADRVDAFALRILSERGATLERGSAALEALKAHRHPWNKATTEQFLAVLKRDVERDRAQFNPFWEARSALRPFALYMDPSVADQVEHIDKRASEVSIAYWTSALTEMQMVLRFRRELYE